MKKDTYIQDNKDTLLQIIEEILSLEKANDEEVLKVISKHPGNNTKTFSKSNIIEAYRTYKDEIGFSGEEEKKFLNTVKMKKVRTWSGVTPVAVLTKPFPCPGNCIYCPNDPLMPKSYLSMEPGAQRAASNKFDPYLQVYNRLVAYQKIGHPTDKVELIVLGGTWSFYPEDYQIWFITRLFKALNDFNPNGDVKYLENKDIQKEKKVSWEDLKKGHHTNEKAKSRCVGLVLETRPDYISEEEIVRLRKLGATKIQIGVQSLDDNVLKMNNRGHGVVETTKAFELLRQAGFKIHAHYMPNLYGSTPEKDIDDYRKLFENENFRPDELKIYPCSLIDNTYLYELYKKGDWRPYTEDELLHVLEKCISFTPRYCRLTRVVRDISSDDIVAGNKKTNFRQIVQRSLEKKGIPIKDIRYREVRNKKVDLEELKIKTENYETGVSTEYFIEYVTSDDKIAGFLRLSMPKKKAYIRDLEDTSIIREVHVYGGAVDIGKEEDGKTQHMGLGSSLIETAERISINEGYKKISVISSIGTREYYRKKGYDLIDIYQVKNLG